MKNNKLLVITGPTATGKTKLAVRLASVFNGEIISADSRQVYKGMDIGTGKDLQDYKLQVTRNKQIPNSKFQRNYKFQTLKIPYYLIDVVNPKTEFNLAKYLNLAHRAIKDAQARGKLPILVGGTGLYVQAIVDGYNLSGVKPDKKLRVKLEKKSVEELQKLLQKLDINYNRNLKNKRYLIRYIEMASHTKQPIKNLLTKAGSEYNCLVIGIKFPRAAINKRIDKRLIQRIENEGMIEEVERLHKQGVSRKRLESFGLEYKFVSYYLRGRLTKAEMIEQLGIAIHQFAKRQMSWLRRWERQGRKIYWVSGYKGARGFLNKWLRK